MRHLAMLAFGLAVLWTSAAPAEPIPAPTVPTSGGASFTGTLYDTTGTWGTATGVDWKASTRVFYRGEVEQEPMEMSWGYLRSYPHPSGSQMLLLLEHSNGLTPIASYMVLGVGQGNQLGPMICYPVDNALFGWQMAQAGTGDVRDLTGLNFYYYVGVSRIEPAPLLLNKNFPLPHTRTCRAQFDFLEGNALYPGPILDLSFNGKDYNSGFAIGWALHALAESPTLAYRPPPMPYGPVAMTASIDGYTSDSVLWPSREGYGGLWYMMLQAEVPDFETFSPDTLEATGMNPPETRIVMRALEWLLSGRVWHLGNIKPYADRNDDDAHDVADLVRLARGRLAHR